MNSLAPRPQLSPRRFGGLLIAGMLMISPYCHGESPSGFPVGHGKRSDTSAIYLTDMSKCTPASALSKTTKIGHWRLVEYESELTNGTMILAGPLTRAPDVTYPLNVTGWHAIYLGYFPPHLSCVNLAAIKIKLTSDPCFVTIADKQMDGLDVVTMREVLWKYADLTGEQIVFGQQSKGRPAPGAVAYLKLVPLTDQQVQAIQADRADRSKRKIIVSNDGGFVAGRQATTKQDIWEQLELYRHSDIGRIDWSVASGDITKYPSKIGWNLHERIAEHGFRPHDRDYVANLKTLIDKGLVPHKVAMQHAHGMGIEFYYMFRMGISSYAPPMDRPATNGGMFSARPDLRKVARDGTPLPTLSYAFKEVRQRMLDIMAEVIDDEVDGINICWIRGMPSIGYEEPAAKAFRQQYGVDLRTVGEDDERYHRLRADFINEFMREIRAVADGVGRRRGRPLAVTAMVTGTLKGAFELGFDLDTWVREKLVDELVAAAVLTRYLQANGVREIVYCAALGTKEYYGKAVTYAECGADGMFVWDITGVQNLAHHWAVLRRLGHAEETVDAGSNPSNVKRIPLKSIGGIDVSHAESVGGRRILTMYLAG